MGRSKGIGALWPDFYRREGWFNIRQLICWRMAGQIGGYRFRLKADRTAARAADSDAIP